VLHPDSQGFFVEVKKPNGVESPLQRVRRKEINNLGIKSYVVYGYEDYMEKIGKNL
jgi:hypothetical protein